MNNSNYYNQAVSNNSGQQQPQVHYHQQQQHPQHQQQQSQYPTLEEQGYDKRQQQSGQPQQQYQHSQQQQQQNPLYNSMQSLGSSTTSGYISSSSITPALAEERKITYLGNNVHSNYARPRPQKKEPKEPMLRTPGAMLHDLCNMSGAVPTFHFVEEGPTHNRSFECHLKMAKEGGFCMEATGKGRTKKDAKHEAAKNLLVQMNADTEKYLIMPAKLEKSGSDSGSNHSGGEKEAELPGNPVGELNEVCLRSGQPPPIYEDLITEGAPHERVFTVCCKLSNGLLEIGKARTKKSAKKVAAWGMLKVILEKIKKEEEELPKVEGEEEEGVDEADTIATEIGNIRLTKSVKKGKKHQPNKANMTRKKANLRHKLILSEFIKKCASFKENEPTESPTVDPVVNLKEIATLNQFSIIYTESDPILEEETKSTTCHCAVSLGGMEFDGIVFFMGKGSSKEEAKAAGAKEVLSFLTHFRK